MGDSIDTVPLKSPQPKSAIKDMCNPVQLSFKCLQFDIWSVVVYLCVLKSFLMCWHVCVSKLISGMWRRHDSLVDVYQTTWHRITQDSNIHIHCCGNLRSHMFFFYVKWLNCYCSIFQICMECVTCYFIWVSNLVSQLERRILFRVQSAEENIWTWERENNRRLERSA